MSDANVNTLTPTFGKKIVYLDCRHNLAASLGRVSVDGCQEFLKPENGRTTEDAMLCVACGCHRNFHRRVVTYKRVSKARHANVVLAMPANPDPIVVSNSREDMEVTTPKMRKKRTVFSPEEKIQMRSFADKLGWRSQKSKKEEIEQFCLEMGMSRQIFLVWLNNNRRRMNINTATI